MNSKNRFENYLTKIAGGEADERVSPATRVEFLLNQISKNSGGGGGGGEGGNYATEQFVIEYVDEQLAQIVDGDEVEF